MNESWALRVYDPAGEIIAACRDLETAIGLLCLSDVGATIWLGVSRPQCQGRGNEGPPGCRCAA